MATSAERQAAFRQRMIEAGFTQVNVWLPAASVADLYRAVELMKENPKLTFAALRNPRGGRFVSIK